MMTMRREDVDSEMGETGVNYKASGESSLVRCKATDGDEDIDDDGRPKRTGTVWTASAHIMTAVIGSGVLALAWAMAQLGWVARPMALLIFSFVTYFTSTLLADCYRYPDPVSGLRNCTYMEAVKTNLGGTMSLVCGFTQYVNIIGFTIGYTITASTSMVAMRKSNCFHRNGHEASCKFSNNPFMIAYGVSQLFLCQIPNIHKLSWLSTVATLMSFCYSLNGIGLVLAKIISGDIGKTSLTGVEVGMNLSEAQKTWRMFNALGNIAFAYAFTLILIEIQDTIRSPSESKKMKKAVSISISRTTLFYVICACFSYAAFGNDAPGNMLTGFGFYEPFWLIDLANICIVVHLLGSFQVVSQPLFSTFESWTARRWPTSEFITTEYPVSISGIHFKCSIDIFWLIWRSIYVVIVTLLSMSFPFNDILALVGAIGHWPLMVFFPVEMHISQKKIKRFTVKWEGHPFLNIGCLLVALAAACGSIHGIIEGLRTFKPFYSKE